MGTPPESDWDDPRLARECQRDARGAWEELLRRYGPVARASARAALGRCGQGTADLDEVVQKVFCEMWEKRKIADLHDPRHLRAYVASLAASRAVDAARFRLGPGERRLRQLGDAEEGGPGMNAPDGQRGPREAAYASEAREVVRRELEGLPFKEAYILRLNAQEELTHQEIAALLEIPQDTVSTVIRRGRERIRKSLELKGLTEF